MATKSSIVPDIIWNWIIETLATFEQADASTLIGLVRIAPAISGDLGKDAREVVSLRILESLFLQGEEAVIDTDSGQNCKSKIRFDSSERCEDVLHQILRETPEHSAKFEKEKWDVRPFLTHKRSSLPKCVLKKLKEAILESSNPLLASLKEKSKLEIPNVTETTKHVNDVNFVVQDTVAKDDLVFLTPRKDKGKFQEKVLQDEILPEDTYDKRVSIDKSMENLEFGVNFKDNNIQPNVLIGEPSKIMKNSMDQDSLINLCVKCNEGGELLVCSSDTCPLRVHENCLGFDVTLDENGNFFCPFCAYSSAISKYREAKRKALQARNDLQSFSSFTVKPSQSESSKKQSEFEENEGKNVGKGCESFKGPKKFSLNGNVSESDIVNGGNVDKCIENAIPQPSTPKRKCKEKESQRSIESSCSRELRKRKAQYTPPRAPLFRRKILPWTKSEEETLKEGVERYPSVNDKGIPWKEILDFGHNVFHKGRTPIDLKDKWRNICKGSPKAK